jgi:hypothetical protein
MLRGVEVMRYVGCFTAILTLGAMHAALAQDDASTFTPLTIPVRQAPMLAMPAEPAEAPPTASGKSPVLTPKTTSAATATALGKLAPAAGPETQAVPMQAAPVIAPASPVAEPAPVAEPIPAAEPAAAEPAAVEPPPAAAVEAPKPAPKPRPRPVARPATPIQPFGSEGSGAIPPLPLDIMTNGNATYVTGGIGDEELEMLKARENDFNVHLLMTSTHGEYIGGVMVRVLNEQGQEVLTANDAGPYLYVKLPPGKYTLEGTATQGGIKSVKVNAPASGYTKAHIVYIE